MKRVPVSLTMSVIIIRNLLMVDSRISDYKIAIKKTEPNTTSISLVNTSLIRRIACATAALLVFAKMVSSLGGKILKSRFASLVV